VKQSRDRTLAALRTVISGEIGSERDPSANIIDSVSTWEWLRPVDVVEPKEIDFAEQIRANVDAARQSDRSRSTTESRSPFDNRHYRVDDLKKDVQTIFREAAGAAQGALRYTTAPHLSGTAHILEWVASTPRRSLTVAVGERAFVWSWWSADRQSIENRADPRLVDVETVKKLVVELTDRDIWHSRGFPSCVI
jgi:hypothetical protein